MIILFNIILPTGDVWSDLNLMYLTLTFNLGDTIELEGCKSCYYKTQKEVYHPEKDLSKNECQTCLYEDNLNCGRYTFILKKLKEMKEQKETCGNNDILRSNGGIFAIGECEDENYHCCITHTNEVKNENPVQWLDPKKLFYPCYSFTKDVDYCYVAGKSSASGCVFSFGIEEKFRELVLNRLINISESSTTENILFYPYSQINQTVEMEERSNLITDPNIKCGLFIYRHNNSDNKQHIPGAKKFTHHCNEDVCLTHLRSLHLLTPITDLAEWRNKTEYLAGVKFGGVIYYFIFSCYCN